MMRRSSASTSSDNPSTSDQYPDDTDDSVAPTRKVTPVSELAPVGTALSPSFPGQVYLLIPMELVLCHKISYYFLYINFLMLLQFSGFMYYVLKIILKFLVIVF